jgi:hypothetical protein
MLIKPVPKGMGHCEPIGQIFGSNFWPLISCLTLHPCRGTQLWMPRPRTITTGTQLRPQVSTWPDVVPSTRTNIFPLS